MPLHALRQSLQRAGASASDRLLLACSGGRDSQVLLHAVAALEPRLEAVVAHVHHGLQPMADDWLDFCAAQAGALGLPFVFRRLTPGPLPGRGAGGLEAWAREWRYRALAEMAMAASARFILTAHHANDQLETVELRRRRGTGVLGLAGMRERAPMPYAPAGLTLIRPFLGLSRQQLQDWADAQGITWVDDPANRDLRFARNQVRQQLEADAAGAALAMPAGLQAIGLFQQAAEQLLRQAADDVAGCSLHVRPAAAGLPPNTALAAVAALGEPSAAAPAPVLSRAAMLRLEAGRRAEALRYWLGLLGCRMPSRAKLGELERQLLLAGASQAMMHHDGVGLLRYRDRIGLLPRPVPVVALYFRWQGEAFIDLPGGRLYFERCRGEGGPKAGSGGEHEAVLSAPDGLPGEGGQGSASTAADCQAGPPDGLAGRFAAGAAPLLDEGWLQQQALLLDQGRGRDRLRLLAGGPSRRWKNLMQEHGVPPCLRASLPVLRSGELLLFAAPFGTMVPSAGSPAAARPGQAGIRLGWVPAPDIQSWL